MAVGEAGEQNAQRGGRRSVGGPGAGATQQERTKAAMAEKMHRWARAQ